MKYDGIIFDLDGTLWDSTRTVAESWSNTLHAHGAPGAFSEEDIAGIMGMTPEEIAQSLFAPYGARARELCDLCLDEESPYVAEHGGRIYEGVEEMFETLSRRCPLFIVSNCALGYIDAFLEYSGFGKYVRDHECKGRQGLSKRENIRLIMERYGLEKVLYVGDTVHDEKNAHAAGCDFFFAHYGFGSAEAPEAVITKPIELIELVE